MWAHTGSVLLTAGGLLQILLAFPSAGVPSTLSLVHYFLVLWAQLN